MHFIIPELLLGILLLVASAITRGTGQLRWFALLLIAWSLNSLTQQTLVIQNPPISYEAAMGLFGTRSFLMGIGLAGFVSEAFCPHLRAMRYTLLSPSALAVMLILLAGFSSNRTLLGLANWCLPVFAFYAACHVAVVLYYSFRPRTKIYRPFAITLGLFFTAAALGSLDVIPRFLRILGVSVGIDTLTFAIFAVAMTSILLRDLWHGWKNQQELNAEFEAARDLQLALVQEPPAAPGFHLQTAYQPARQTGGDFFQFLPAPDGALLVVVGDVSGKGFNAAMLVSVAIGALGHMASYQPADVLHHLNCSIMGKTCGAFITCCCALIKPNGHAVIANAGHIAPYLGTQPVELESGLPLGILPDVEYTEATLQLGEQTLTLLSDGIVEAQNQKGELFGFDRTAAAIAKQAQDFGQEDDITVVQILCAA